MRRKVGREIKEGDCKGKRHWRKRRDQRSGEKDKRKERKD